MTSMVCRREQQQQGTLAAAGRKRAWQSSSPPVLSSLHPSLPSSSNNLLLPSDPAVCLSVCLSEHHSFPATPTHPPTQPSSTHLGSPQVASPHQHPLLSSSRRQASHLLPAIYDPKKA